MALLKIFFSIFHGTEIQFHLHELQQISKVVYSEYPYLYEKHPSYDAYINSFPSLSESFIVIAYDKDKPIGMAIGCPMNEVWKFIPNYFNEDTSDMYHLAELALLVEYRGQGLGGKLYEIWESHVPSHYKRFSLSCIEDSRYDAYKPKGYVSVNTLWKKLGYHHTDVQFNEDWIHVGETEFRPHNLVFWIKARRDS